VEEVLSTGCTGGVCAFGLQLRSVIITPVWLAVRVDLHACMRSSAPHLLPRLACFLPDTRGLYMYAGVSTLQSRELLITFFPLASFLGQKPICHMHSILPVSVNQIFPWTEYIVRRETALFARSPGMYYELHVGAYMYLPSLLIRV
jgi:hypothetical protein